MRFSRLIDTVLLLLILLRLGVPTISDDLLILCVIVLVNILHKLLVHHILWVELLLLLERVLVVVLRRVNLIARYRAELVDLVLLDEEEEDVLPHFFEVLHLDQDEQDDEHVDDQVDLIVRADVCDDSTTI